jgi:hypothetical protein
MTRAANGDEVVGIECKFRMGAELLDVVNAEVVLATTVGAASVTSDNREPELAPGR